MKKLESYIEETRDEVKSLCLKYIDEFTRGIRSHPSRQKEENGLRLHTVQVIEKALELNQRYDRRDIIETCLVHDLKHWKEFPLAFHQIRAIEATKGLSYDYWRQESKFVYRFVVLILISDMWSAFINEKDL